MEIKIPEQRNIRVKEEMKKNNVGEEEKMEAIVWTIRSVIPFIVALSKEIDGVRTEDIIFRQMID